MNTDTPTIDQLRAELATARAIVAQHETGDKMICEMLGMPTIAEGIEKLRAEVTRLTELGWNHFTCLHHNDEERAAIEPHCPVCLSAELEKVKGELGRAENLLENFRRFNQMESEK